MGNIADRIEINEEANDSSFERMLVARHLVTTRFPIAPEMSMSIYNNNNNRAIERNHYANEMKAKIVTYFYGKILVELNEFRHKNSDTMSIKALADLTKIIERIEDGSITDESELSR